MIRYILPLLLFSLSGIASITKAQSLTVSEKATANSFLLADAFTYPIIYTDSSDETVVQIAATAFSKDIQRITGKEASFTHTPSFNKPYQVVIGTIGKSALIDQLVKENNIQVKSITGLRESFSIQIIEKSQGKQKTKLLVIAGSDRRGTAYGVFELSRKMGVSPLYWWGDITPAHKDAVYISGTFTSSSPSVEYRGIFLNDEDWGLQPWAALNQDTAIKDIGPRTYERIFELLLRLKANYIWPAMHPCTKAFYYYQENPQLADKYAIVVGGSHCEPMLRNNVFEWAENYEHEYGKKPGEWRYDLNKQEIYNYWKDRVAQSAPYESIYTVGMRGIHDGSMPGPKNIDEKLKLLDTVIRDQRQLFQQVQGKDAATVPQIFCPYKEVLTLYQRGLQLPDDVTIVWADDNHGYIRQLSTPTEQQRSGGSGVYYHLSYWGAPHDYLWLSTISPSLISFELSKAWQYNARKVWVINVGDIKPAEMETQFAFDLAWNVDAWPPEKAGAYARQWAAETFGESFADDIAAIKEGYYRLAAAGKPEHLGMLSFSEAQLNERLKSYRTLANQASALQSRIPARLQDAYFELIYYPVQGAKLMNEKIALAAKSRLYMLSQPAIARQYADSAAAAFEHIQQLTKHYNQDIAGGKWNGMMSWHPRNLPVFYMPPTATHADTTKAGKSFSNIDTTAAAIVTIPATAFSQKQEQRHTHIQAISQLGYTGSGITCLPVTTAALKENEWQQASSVEYTANLPAGKRTIHVRCLPTHRQHTGRGVRYAICVNNEQPQVVELETPTDNAVWKQNVLQGYAEGITTHQVSTPGSKITIYFLDPGVVINDISIY